MLCMLGQNMQLSHSGYIPEFVTVTEGKKHDVTVGRTLHFPKGSIVVIDKADNDYDWYNQLTEKGVLPVTRLKSSAKYRTVLSSFCASTNWVSCYCSWLVFIFPRLALVCDRFVLLSIRLRRWLKLGFVALRCF